MALTLGALNAHGQAVYQFAYTITDSGSAGQIYIKQVPIATPSLVTPYRFNKSQVNITTSSFGAVNIFSGINTNQTPQLTINAYPNGDSILIKDQYGTHNFSGNKSAGFAAYLSALVGPGYLNKYIISNTLTQVKTGTGVLHSIVIDSAAASGGAGGKVLIIDGTDTTTLSPRIGVPRTTTVGTIIYDTKFHTGLLIKEEGTSEITVVYYYTAPEMWEENYFENRLMRDEQ